MAQEKILGRQLNIGSVASDLAQDGTITITEAQITDLKSYLLNVVEDTTPQLGADLDVNAFDIVSGADTAVDLNAGSLNLFVGDGSTNGVFDATVGIVSASSSGTGETSQQYTFIRGQHSAYVGGVAHSAGHIDITAGSHTVGSQGSGGNIDITAGQSTSSNNGGNVIIYGGNPNAGGAIRMVSGYGIGAGANSGGSLTLKAGVGANLGAGGNTFLEGGQGGGTSGIAGYVEIRGGNAASGQTAGDIKFQPGGGSGANGGSIEAHAPRNQTGQGGIEFWRDTNTSHSTGNNVLVRAGNTLAANRTFTLPENASATGNVLTATDSNGTTAWAAPTTDLVNDTTPQLGADLDVNGFYLGTGAGSPVTGSYINLNSNVAEIYSVTEVAIYRGQGAAGSALNDDTVAILSTSHDGEKQFTNLTGQDSSTTFDYGGSIQIWAGDSTVYRGGYIDLRAGTGNGTTGGSRIFMTGGENGVTSGPVSVRGGTAPPGGTIHGGAASLEGGSASNGTGNGGNVSLIGGLGGSGGATSGGNIYIEPGEAGPSGTEGSIYLGPTNNNNDAVEVRFAVGATPNYIALKSPSTLSGDTVWTLPAAQGVVAGSPSLAGVLGIDLGEFTVAGLPAAADYANCWALVTDAGAGSPFVGRVTVRSDGTNWKMISPEGATVS